ncbi:F5/8_type C domain-containing protein [Hexamita inflata]|uniref:F5/8 type C domain-containing protein n=1 Tax=Hexamita inflata TaxID=28002 RepID=A0AA86Q4R0_9EUKA|nr:F5/8 type C domain-containing protein [Hexamita inflata]CAI9945679.1 F5/8 type C domain-containing protein [Hexamita inflata]CAI9965193.1 F5/8 type C domain-containing protein [Hexamita inflata]
MKNFALKANGAKIHYFSSQYHHGCLVTNLIESDPSCCWFSSAYTPLPQHVVIELAKSITLEKIGIFMHGDNNQNPQEIKFYTSADGQEYTEIVYDTVEQRAGDFLWTVHKQNVKYIKYEVLENYGGSGAYTTQIYCYGSE